MHLGNFTSHQQKKDQSSFPLVIDLHKVDNIGIFVQFLMDINGKKLRTESSSMQFYICHDVLNS